MTEKFRRRLVLRRISSGTAPPNVALTVVAVSCMAFGMAVVMHLIFWP